jgi:hypothetical protein
MNGIPYANEYWDEDLATAYKVCPECAVRITLYDRKDFESFTGAEYADHYIAEHSS